MNELATISGLINIVGWPLVTVWAIFEMKTVRRQYYFPD